MKNEKILDLISKKNKFYQFLVRASLLLIMLKLAFDFRDMLQVDPFGREKSSSDILFSLVFRLFGYTLFCYVVIRVVTRVTEGAFKDRAVEELCSQFNNLIRSDFQWVWFESPGIFSIDCQDKYLWVNSSSTGYSAIRLDAGNIVSSKVERSVFVETETVYGPGSLSDVANRNPVSRSSSRSRESIVLEITYMGSDNLPYVVSIPFDEDRISAERAQYMIQMFA